MITEVEIGKRLRAERERARVTQAELASRMQVAVTTVQRLEAGTANATLRTILSYCECVGLHDPQPIFAEESRIPADVLALLERCTPSQIEAIRAVLLGFVISQEKSAAQSVQKLRKARE